MAASMPTFLSQTSNELSERINNILDTFSTSRASDTSQSMVFNNEEEPQPGLVNYIRRNTLTDEVRWDLPSSRPCRSFRFRSIPMSRAISKRVLPPVTVIQFHRILQWNSQRKNEKKNAPSNRWKRDWDMCSWSVRMVNRSSVGKGFPIPKFLPFCSFVV